ncbi:DUF4333 domain-containing protein [Nocardioides sp. ChNu-153]|uniref:DUF4333 domain-containing protein n=1 Tax=unclassified Nocardioides TaxID=2615069 RepID=UPI002406EA1B|nr:MULTISPECIES: DUF4333 domain-containing protein [unclassified Nocardioides]MDF9714576.1 DUF4333 domain-containing protein [Nocardioides sp. ChNu-99]MDN7119891.1 DUF4333 domain-containing protein [Nocardioides sp. ChNu-153]
MRSPLTTGTALLAPAAVVAALLLGGCSSQVAQDDVEDQITEQLTEVVGQEPADVDCPDDLEAEEGATMTCVLTAEDDTTIDVGVEVTAVDGDDVSFDIQVADEPNE